MSNTRKTRQQNAGRLTRDKATWNSKPRDDLRGTAGRGGALWRRYNSQQNQPQRGGGALNDLVGHMDVTNCIWH
jgi:hypothetical protein